MSLTARLCALLGCPPTALNGERIPRGQGCDELRGEVAPLVGPLSELELGETGRITFIHPRFTERLDRLSALGLVPGTDVKLKQRYPSIVIEVGATTLALDGEVARDVFVKPVSRG